LEERGEEPKQIEILDRGNISTRLVIVRTTRRFRRVSAGRSRWSEASWRRSRGESFLRRRFRFGVMDWRCAARA